MTDAEALLEIAEALKTLAAAVGGLALPLWLMLIFKNMNGDNKAALEKVAEAIRNRGGQSSDAAG